MDTPNVARTSERRGIQSIEVGYTLIQVLAAANTKLSLSKLAAAAGMTPSKAHLYLASYLRIGLAVQDPTTTHYGLGPSAIQLGLAAIRQLDVLDVARNAMEELQQDTGLSISLSIWGNKGPTIIHKLDGEMPFPVTVRVGVVMPLLRTATGRIFYAYLPEREWHSLVEREVHSTPTALHTAAACLNDIRRYGISSSESLLSEGFAGIAGPIFDHNNRLAAAVAVFGLQSMVDTSPDGPIADSVRHTAAKISRGLGQPIPA